MAYRIVYCQGSFALAASCDSLEQALSRARSLSAKAGVWHVQVEDSEGRPVVRSFELQASPGRRTMRSVPEYFGHPSPARAFATERPD
jgi:hypothetical protein